MSQSDPSDIERDIEATREHLAETVDALTEKLDVKSRAKQAYAEADKRKLGGIVGGAVLALVVLVVWRRRR
jgi:cobalamin biosynthesis Mg chelatase CobN